MSCFLSWGGHGSFRLFESCNCGFYFCDGVFEPLFFDSGESEFYDFFYPVSSQNNWDSYGAV